MRMDHMVRLEGLEMPWQKLVGNGGWLGRVLRSRLYFPVSLAVILLLLTGISANIMLRVGLWQPSFLQPRQALVITGPGVNPARIQAYILGAVRTPGVYALPEGSRVHDLVDAAGGALTSADLTRVDLAAVLSDGQEIYVPVVGEPLLIEQGGKINVNVATAIELHRALGISMPIAERIVAYRTAHGNFTAVSQLLLVPISRSTYDRIKDLVTV